MRRLFLPAALAALMTGGAFAADSYTPGSENDLRLRHAKFLGASKQYYSAIALMLEIQREGGSSFQAPPDFWESLAEYQLAYGLHDEAEQAYRNLAEDAIEAEDRFRAQLKLAEFEYQRGYLDLARASRTVDN